MGADTRTEESPAQASEHRRHTAWPIAAWLLVVASAGVLGVGVYGELLSATLILDLVSFWPGLVVAILLALAVWPLRRRMAARLAAVLPLLLLTWMWGGVALHLSEWELLPSSAADLEGPRVPGVTRAEVEIVSGGEVRLRAGTDLLYTVRLLREAGDTGVPQALERIEGDEAQVDVVEGEAGRWFRTVGWETTLAAGPIWDVAVRGAEVDLDLRPLEVAGVDVWGSGVVRLPPVASETQVRLEGRLRVQVPEGVPVEVLGPALVPSDWVVTDTGWRAPVSGTGYLMAVAETSQVIITEESD